MARSSGIRRFLRFKLRSLLLLTLVVAAWLGYEVHQARTVERQAAAIRALGGEVEFEPSAWSLLRFVEPQRYGRRIVAIQVANERLEEAIPLLRPMTALREVRIVYDGASDTRQNWESLQALVGDERIVPVAGPEEPASFGAAWKSTKRRERWRRFAEKCKEAGSAQIVSTEPIQFGGRDFAPAPTLDSYQPVKLRDGSLAEVLLVWDLRFSLSNLALPCSLWSGERRTGRGKEAPCDRWRASARGCGQRRLRGPRLHPQPSKSGGGDCPTLSRRSATLGSALCHRTDRLTEPAAGSGMIPRTARSGPAARRGRESISSADA
jgi:hypothetical protein